MRPRSKGDTAHIRQFSRLPESPEFLGRSQWCAASPRDLPEELLTAQELQIFAQSLMPEGWQDSPRYFLPPHPELAAKLVHNAEDINQRLLRLFPLDRALAGSLAWGGSASLRHEALRHEALRSIATRKPGGLDELLEVMRRSLAVGPVGGIVPSAKSSPIMSLPSSPRLPSPAGKATVALRKPHEKLVRWMHAGD